MLLFLIRHAHAVTAEEQPRRPLSVRGRADLERLGAWLRTTAVFRPAQFWHSPLERAAETARLLGGGLAPESLLVETDGLLPDDDPKAMARRLAEYPVKHDLALVGHDPHLSALATLLVRGKESPEIIALRKGAVVALERTPKLHRQTAWPRWRIRWHLSPELLPPDASGGSPPSAQKSG